MGFGCMPPSHCFPERKGVRQWVGFDYTLDERDEDLLVRCYTGR